MCERSMNWAFKIIKTLTIFYSDPDATTFTHGFSTSNLLACRVIPSCLWSLFMFTSVAKGASFTIKRRLCTEPFYQLYCLCNWFMQSMENLQF